MWNVSFADTVIKLLPPDADRYGASDILAIVVLVQVFFLFAYSYSFRHENTAHSVYRLPVYTIVRILIMAQP